jgi:monoamine oxidase
MNNRDVKNILIIGAGAAGLMAATELEAAGFEVLVLEAREYVGGRIQTLTDDRFSVRIEAGAEFIHGELKLSKATVKSAEAELWTTDGKFYECISGSIKESNFEAPGWEEMMAALGKLQKDIPIKEFMDQRFPPSSYPDLYGMVMRFVQGYDAADPRKISSLALREEWRKSTEQNEYRLTDGYQKMIGHLAAQLNGPILLNKTVEKIDWQNGHVKVFTSDSDSFEASSILITVPIGLLQKEKLQFSPPLPLHLEASQQIGFGSVIKFIFEFQQSFWDERVQARYKDFAFIFSDAAIPTWWSQFPKQYPMLTGWLGGPNADKLPGTALQFRTAVDSLSYVLGCTQAEIEANIRAWHIADWSSDPLSLGAYSYPTIQSETALKFFSLPVKNTLFFAGEAYYEGDAVGTVEAALYSGKETAKKMIAVLSNYQV